MCVLEILVLKIFWIERLFWEIFVLIGLLVELYVGLHSYLCFSHLEKLFWKTVLTPPRYLVVCQASLAFSYRNLDSFSIPGGSIELLFLDLIPCCLILARYLSCRQAFPRHLPRQLPRHLICRDLLSVLFKSPRAIRTTFHSISLSIALYFLYQTLSSHSNLYPQRFLQAFSRFSSIGKPIISHSSCSSCFET